jgi:autotransporter passenger strand-loop-strand repeat protein
METLIQLTVFTRRQNILQIAIALLFFLRPHFGYSQCAAAPIAAAICSGGNGAASNGLSINTGTTYWVSSSAAFTSLTLNGGTLRICGSLTVSAFTINNGGNLVIESGGSLSVTSMSTINGGLTLINRGSFISTSGFTIQNTNHIYNDLSTSVMSLGGTVTFPGSSTTVVNRGVMSFSSLSYSAATGSFCLQDNSITNIGTLDNESTNSFTYSGSGFPACINISGSAKLGHDLASSSTIHVCKGGSVTVTGGATTNPGGGWGSALLTNNCSSCATILDLPIDHFTATTTAGGVGIKWETNADGPAGGQFYIERSTDGASFQPIAVVTSVDGQQAYTANDNDIATTPVRYYRIQVLLSSGAGFYSPVVALRSGSIAGQLSIFPNPARPGSTINMNLRSLSAGIARLSLIDLTGRILFTRNIPLAQGSNIHTWDPGKIIPGMYTLRIDLPGGTSLYDRLSVLAP